MNGRKADHRQRRESTFTTSGGGGGAPDAHATSHQNGGSDEISVAGLSGLLADAQTPVAHAIDSTTYHSAASDNTDLNVSTTAHGLMKKLPNVATQVFDGTGSWRALAASDLPVATVEALGVVAQTSPSTSPRAANVGKPRQWMALGAGNSATAGISSWGAVSIANLDASSASNYNGSDGLGIKHTAVAVGSTRYAGSQITMGNSNFCQIRHHFYLSARILTPTDMADKTIWVGAATNAAAPATAEWPTLGDGCWFISFVEGTNSDRWRIYSKATASATGTATDLGVAAVASTLYTVEMYSDGALLYGRVNGSAWTSHTPAPATTFAINKTFFPITGQQAGNAVAADAVLLGGYFEQE